MTTPNIFSLLSSSVAQASVQQYLPESISGETLQEYYQEYQARLSSTGFQEERSTQFRTFDNTVGQVIERGKYMRPFNKRVVRRLNYGGSLLRHIPGNKLFFGRDNNQDPAQLVSLYCQYFSEQANDFGTLFFQVLERERSLQQHTGRLLEQRQYYQEQAALLKEHHATEKTRVLTLREELRETSLAPDVQQSAYAHVEAQCRDLLSLGRNIAVLTQENTSAEEESTMLLAWCRDMKHVLAVSKESMENQAEQLKETVPIYLQALRLAQGLRHTRETMHGLSSVMHTAQHHADQGLESMIQYFPNNRSFSHSLL